MIWHPDILPILPRLQLLALHRELCNLRGRGWGAGSKPILRDFHGSWGALVGYHFQVMGEMKARRTSRGTIRNYRPNPKWEAKGYRGRGHASFDDADIEIKRFRECTENHKMKCLKILVSRIKKANENVYSNEERYRVISYLQNG